MYGPYPPDYANINDLIESLNIKKMDDSKEQLIIKNIKSLAKRTRDLGGKVVGDNNQTVWYNVCWLGSKDAVEILLKNNKNSINIESEKDGKKEITPLAAAVWNGHKEVVETLLEQDKVVEYLLDESKYSNFNYLIKLANIKIKETESIKEVNETRKRLFEIEASNSQPQSLKKQDIDKIKQEITKNQKRIEVYTQIRGMINEKIPSSAEQTS